jgi:hypothetical protein
MNAGRTPIIVDRVSLVAWAGLFGPFSPPLQLPSGGRVPSVNGVAWADLGREARAFRIAHAAFSMLQLAGLAYVWGSAVTRRRDRLLTLSVAALLVEGAALVVGRGDCPFGPLQTRLGDPVPLFELVLPKRAAKAAIPLLALVAVAGIAAVMARPPGAKPAR